MKELNVFLLAFVLMNIVNQFEKRFSTLKDTGPKRTNVADYIGFPRGEC